MGFCLAELAFTLTIPSDAAAFVSQWPELAEFAFAFIFISVLWWFHRKLFETYFVLNPVTISLNFVMLGCLALAIYFLQVFVHFILARVDSDLAAVCWTGSLAIVFGIVTIQYGIGLFYRHACLSPEDLRWGVNRAFRSSVVSIVTGTFAIGSALLGRTDQIAIAVAAVVVLLGFARRKLVPIIVSRILASREPATV
jgi:Endosomal/lysosomal potassium channel TMEM175